VLCGINKELILLTSDHSVVLANCFPIGDFSLLVVPKRHVPSITDLTAEELNDMIQSIALATNHIKANLNPEGVNTFLNEGEIAGQTIPHLHFHIVPRTSGDGLQNFKRKGEKIRLAEDKLELVRSMF
jgi:histidine triad (HIT) family protein